MYKRQVVWTKDRKHIFPPRTRWDWLFVSFYMEIESVILFRNFIWFSQLIRLETCEYTEIVNEMRSIHCTNSVAFSTTLRLLKKDWVELEYATANFSVNCGGYLHSILISSFTYRHPWHLFYILIHSRSVSYTHLDVYKRQILLF